MAINLDDNLNINAAKPTRTTDLVGTGQLYATKEDIPAYLLFEGLTTYDIDNSAAWIYQGSAWVANEVNFGNYSFDGGLMSVLGQSVINGSIGEMYMNEDAEMTILIGGQDIKFPNLTNTIIDAGTDQFATTKGWVNSKIPSLGNYSFSYNNMSTSDGNIISITGVNNIIDIGTPAITETLNLNAQGIFLVNSSISDINSAPDKVAVTKEWVNAYKASLYATKKTEAGTSYTIQASDLGKNIHFTAATTITVTLPNGLATGFKCNLIKAAAGNVVITATTTLHSNGNSLKSLYTMAEVIHEGSDVWSAYGGKLTV